MDPGVANSLAAEVSFEPFKKVASDEVVLIAAPYSRHARVRVLAILVEAVTGHEDRCGKIGFCEERLILVELKGTAVALVPTSYGLDQRAPYQQTRWDWRGTRTQRVEGKQRLGRGEYPILPRADLNDAILIIWLARPAVPVAASTADEADLRLGGQNLYLSAKLVLQPDIVGVDVGDVGAGGDLHSRVPGRAWPKVPVIGMFEVTDLPRISGCVVTRYSGAAIARTVVHEDVFPSVEVLGQNALHGLGEKALGIQEGRDDRDDGPRAHADPTDIPISSRARLSPSQLGTVMRGSSKGSVADVSGAGAATQA
jgi:hypothetical protein